MTALQRYSTLANTAADLLTALDKLDITNSSIHRSNCSKLRKDLKLQIIQCRMYLEPPKAAQPAAPKFNHKYSHLAR